MEPKYILLKPKLYFSNNILLFGNFAATALQVAYSRNFIYDMLSEQLPFYYYLSEVPIYIH